MALSEAIANRILGPNNHLCTTRWRSCMRVEHFSSNRHPAQSQCLARPMWFVILNVGFIVYLLLFACGIRMIMDIFFDQDVMFELHGENVERVHKQDNVGQDANGNDQIEHQVDDQIEHQVEQKEKKHLLDESFGFDIKEILGNKDNISSDSFGLLEEIMPQAMQNNRAGSFIVSPLEDSLVQFEALEYIAETGELCKQLEKEKDENTQLLVEKQFVIASDQEVAMPSPVKRRSVSTPRASVKKQKTLEAKDNNKNNGSAVKSSIPMSTSMQRSILKTSSNLIQFSDKKPSATKQVGTISTRKNAGAVVGSRLPVPKSRLPVFKTN